MSKPRPDPPQLPAGMRRGLALWDQCLYFEAHEEMEAAWLSEAGPLRAVWQGLIQAVVACYQIERGNSSGARKMIDAAIPKLEPHARDPHGSSAARVPIDLSSLIEDLRDRQRALSRGARVEPFRPPRFTVD